MRYPAIALVVVTVVVAPFAHAALETGKTPPPLLVNVVAGDAAETIQSIVSRQGPHPYAVVFVQKADEGLTRFVKALDEFVISQQASRLRAYIVVCSDEGIGADWLTALKQDCPLTGMSICTPLHAEQVAAWQPHPEFPVNAWFFNESVLVQRWVVTSPLTSNLAGKMRAVIKRALAPKRQSESSGCNCR